MKRYSLKKTLFSVFVQSVLLPFVLISVIVFGIYYGHILNNYKTNSQMALQSMNNHLSSYLEDVERFFLQYLFDESISDFYHYVNTNDIDKDTRTKSEYAVHSRRYSVTVVNFRITNEDVYEGIGFIPKEQNKNTCFYLQKPDGNRYSSYGYRGLDECEDEHLTEYEWYQSLEKLKVGEELIMYGSPMDHFSEYATDENMITIIKQCNYVETGRAQGYIFLEISESKMASLFENISIPNGASILVYTPDRNIAYATDREIVLSSDMQKLGTEAHGKYVTVDGKGYYVFNSKVEEYDFIVSYLLPQKIILTRCLALL